MKETMKRVSEVKATNSIFVYIYIFEIKLKLCLLSIYFFHENNASKHAVSEEAMRQVRYAFVILIFFSPVSSAKVICERNFSFLFNFGLKLHFKLERTIGFHVETQTRVSLKAKP